MAKNILWSLMAALLAALACWIVTVNLYTTAKAFQHAGAAPARAFRWGFVIAAVAAAAVFVLTLYVLVARDRRKTSRR
ncbi:MAG TPA: hypothetical protein VGZ29_08520 [Terriglobia bacterium]|nr:hypothetical protein [Terriglobia bacterium]